MPPVDFSATVLAAGMTAFADPVIYKPKSEPSYSARGVFDEYYEEIKIADGMPVTIKTPVLGIRLSDFQTLPAQGDCLIVHCRDFEVREPRPDGHGGMKLMLNFKGPAL